MMDERRKKTLVDVIHIDGALVAIQADSNTQAYGSFSGGHRNDEKGENLPLHGIKIAAHGDQVQIHRVQHQLYGEKHHDDIAP